MTFGRNQKRKHGVSYHVDTKAYFKVVLAKRYGSAMWVSHTYVAASSRTESQSKMPGIGWVLK